MNKNDNTHVNRGDPKRRFDELSQTFDELNSKCPACDGNKTIEGKTCATCSGTGKGPKIKPSDQLRGD